jgi:hypothetical protein
MGAARNLERDPQPGSLRRDRSRKAAIVERPVENTAGVGTVDVENCKWGFVARSRMDGEERLFAVGVGREHESVVKAVKFACKGRKKRERCPLTGVRVVTHILDNSKSGMFS